jgi:hypothetical protein
MKYALALLLLFLVVFAAFCWSAALFVPTCKHCHAQWERYHSCAYSINERP